MENIRVFIADKEESKYTDPPIEISVFKRDDTELVDDVLYTVNRLLKMLGHKETPMYFKFVLGVEDQSSGSAGKVITSVVCENPAYAEDRNKTIVKINAQLKALLLSLENKQQQKSL
jgi:hypothetical protein